MAVEPLALSLKRRPLLRELLLSGLGVHWGLEFRVEGTGFGVWGSGFGVLGLGFGVWGLGVGSWGLGV